MHTLTRGLLTLALAATTAMVHGHVSRTAQDPKPEPPKLPRQTDWFLSTGDWETDPQLYVREFGSGTAPIVVLHGGWGAEHSGLLTALEGLADRHRFILYDQRGSLRSPSPEALITFERHVEDLERLRQELQVERLRLVGHSMGAVLAGAYAAKYPSRIEQLVLLAPAYLKNPIPEEDKPLQHQGNVASRAFLTRPEIAHELARYALDRRVPPLSSQEQTARYRIGFAARMLYDVRHWPRLTGGRSLYKGRVDELTSKTYPASGWDYFQEFGKHTYRVSIIAGDHDFLDFGNLLIRKWAASVPRVELSIIENAGHLLWIDEPERLTKVLLMHLERPKAGSQP
jgi:pimeloyl-ACP methyl ester carboxylesterase